MDTLDLIEDGGDLVVDFEALDTKLATSDVLYLNTPQNPSGKVFDGDWLRAVIRYCEERDIFVLLDDIYHRLVFDGRRAVHGFDCTARAVDEAKVVVLNGVSKQYAMTGFRIGWAVANRTLIEAMTNIQGHETSGPSVLLQHAAVGAINGLQSPVEGLRATLENNRNVLMAELQAFEGVVIAKRNRGLNSSFTVRKISHGEGVERVFPLHSPRIDSVELVRRGDASPSELVDAAIARIEKLNPEFIIERFAGEVPEDLWDDDGLVSLEIR